MFFTPYSLSLSGLYLSFAGALLCCTADLGKRYLMQRTNSVEFVLLLRGAAHVVFFAMWAAWEGIPVKALDMSFFVSCLLLGGFNALASWLYLGALKQSLDLSLPYLGVGPFFVTFLSYLVFEDVPKKSYNILGLLLILLGYLGMNLSQPRLFFSHLFFPSSKPSRQMLVVAVIWNVSQLLEKNSLNYVTPIQFALYVQGVSFLLSFFVLGLPALSRQGTLPIAHGGKDRVYSVSGSSGRRSSIVDWELVTSFVSVSAVSLLAYYVFLMAVRSTYVTFVMLTKRLGIILTVFMGRFFFPEDYNRFRFLCCVVIQVGCALVYLPQYGFWFAENWETGPGGDDVKLSAAAT